MECDGLALAILLFSKACQCHNVNDVCDGSTRFEVAFSQDDDGANTRATCPGPHRSLLYIYLIRFNQALNSYEAHTCKALLV